MPITRRKFVAGTAAGITTAAFAQGPTILERTAAKPVVISSANGNKFKNGGEATCVQKAFTLMTQGTDVLDALIAGVNIIELDPLDDSVGFGGLPNADGEVELDSSCMHGPKKRAGAVAGLKGIRTPSLVAKAVMEMTDHHLLVGDGAQRFARQMGFKVEDDLNTDNSRALWLEWKRRTDPSHFLDPKTRAEAGDRIRKQMVAEGKLNRDTVYGTINCDGVNAKGDVCGVTTTSGLAWKIPGRVGDSPILGAGLYVENEVGAAGSTGRGEANLYNLSSFFIVQAMAAGKSPKDAGIEALRRIKASTIEKRILNDKGNPNFGITFYIVNRKGDFAGVSMYEGKEFAVCTEKGPRTLAADYLLTGKP